MQNKYPEKVKIFEVGPRDGLQNQKEFIATDKKVEFVNRLIDAGCKYVEVTSFVHPKWVPQLKDAREVFKAVQHNKDIVMNALIPNLKGLELAINAGLNEVVTILSCSESHNMKNLNMSVSSSLKEIETINSIAAQNHVRVRSYIAAAYGCPFEGAIALGKVVEIAQALESMGSYEISLGDTTGMADPILSYKVSGVVKDSLKKADLAVHFHQSDGIEFANTLAALDAGITVFDGAAGGLGGCPYAPGATGNCATETMVTMFKRMGIDTGIDEEKIHQCGAYAKSLIVSSCNQ